jgi:hypothetical protein
MDKQMDRQVLQTLRKIRNDFGEDIFKNEKQFKNIIDGLLPGRDMANTRECLILALKSNAYTRLTEAAKKDDISLESLSLANIVLQKNKKLDLNFAKAVINTLALLCKEPYDPSAVVKTEVNTIEKISEPVISAPQPKISEPIENNENNKFISISESTQPEEIVEITEKKRN